MTDTESGNDGNRPQNKTPSEEFIGYCEAEFERRRNSGDDFDEARYQQAMDLALAKLRRLEEGGRA